MTGLLVASVLAEALAFLGGPAAYERATSVDESLVSSMCLERHAALPQVYEGLDIVEVSPPVAVTVTPVRGSSRMHRVSGHHEVTARDTRNSLTRTVRITFHCLVYGRGDSPWRYRISSTGNQYPNPDSIFNGRRPPQDAQFQQSRRGLATTRQGAAG